MIKVLHLYYDLLNLYGEQGNVLALKDFFKNQNIEISIDYLSLKDEIDFNNYDIVYLGSGSNENLLLALEDIKRYKKELTKYIDNNNYLISTGNSYLLFGQKIDELDALGIFDYYAKSTDRIRCHSFMQYQDLSPIVGFQNRSFIVQNNENHLFKVIDGNADNLKSEYEGYHYKNFFGTFLVGPLLIRNPHFTDLIIADISKKHDYKYHIDIDTFEYKAYYEYLKNFYKK